MGRKAVGAADRIFEAWGIYENTGSCRIRFDLDPVRCVDDPPERVWISWAVHFTLGKLGEEHWALARHLYVFGKPLYAFGRSEWVRTRLKRELLETLSVTLTTVDQHPIWREAAIRAFGSPRWQIVLALPIWGTVVAGEKNKNSFAKTTIS